MGFNIEYLMKQYILACMHGTGMVMQIATKDGHLELLRATYSTCNTLCKYIPYENKLWIMLVSLETHFEVIFISR